MSPQPMMTLVELTTQMRELSARMALCGAAVRYYGGFGAFAEYGALLEEQSAPVCLAVAEQLERMHGAGHA